MRLPRIILVLGLAAVYMPANSTGASPEKPAMQELRLKNGTKVTILWDSFKIHKFTLYMKGSTAYLGNQRLQDQSPIVRQIVQWAAEEKGIQGDIEQHLKDSIRLPLDQRIVAARPLILELPYATGVDVGARRKITIPLCALEPADQQMMWDAATKMQAYRAHIARENRKVRAAEDAAEAAAYQAWMMQEIALNTWDMLGVMLGY